jgi:hypothetical protein
VRPATWLLVAIIVTYRLIPARVRGLWRFNGPTSGVTLERVRAGGGWPAFRQGITPEWFGAGP